ncbi:MAG TPA: carbamate kinase [Candidatus Cloacimonas acidaminovorans]|jgi:carbamate kinase|nr:carbamate kinase [Candidatus Cloacimonas sp.]MDD3606461.1 carbamate kinase [Candidatus Cloacimonas acidaminovorans]HOE55558.1 carbamate kinase [Candidatus Cloacimonas acidaminovorans]HOI02026.1 carbamate kinase [Candidatus Cloacimonas acidaminovorans]HOM79486.1 carbamate kinase [Candidatus Cloacimonas acidaminovorans]
MNKTAVLALGGNAIIKAGEKGTITQQFANTRESLSGIVELIKRGYHLSITHGNGPQVGNLLRQQEAGEKEGIPQLPLGVLNAATEGTMGYMIEQSLQNKLHKSGIKKRVITIISQVVVDKNDPSMLNPTKFVGSTYYTAQQAEELHQKLGWILKEDSGKGFRRVVPSPYPIQIIPAATIKELVDRGEIVIAVGGGGIPIYIEEDGTYEGVDAVIDKDFASSLLALEIKADLFVILTGVEKVAINYGKENQQDLDRMTVAEAKRYFAEKQFPAGSMGPKIQAAIDFLERGGSEVLITSIEKIVDAFEGKTGTRIV